MIKQRRCLHQDSKGITAGVHHPKYIALTRVGIERLKESLRRACIIRRDLGRVLRKGLVARPTRRPHSLLVAKRRQSATVKRR